MKIRLLPFLLLFLAVSCHAQQTTVTATVTDPSAHPYSFLTGYASLVCPGNQAPTYNGYSMPRTFSITGSDGNGTFTQVLYDVNLITPSGCGYQWHITWKDGVTSFITGSITSVTGASVNESAAISAFSVPLPPPPTGILLETNGTTNTVQSTLNLLNGTGISLTADGSGGVTVTNVNPVNLSASSPIVVSPNPITSTGTVSCPTCNTSSATIAGTITASHIPYASGSNTLADIIGSSVTGGTGAIALTAGADTTTPLSILRHSATQTAPLLLAGDPTSGLNAGTPLPTGRSEVQGVSQNTSTSPKDVGVLGVVEADNAVSNVANVIAGGYFSASALTNLYTVQCCGTLVGVQGIATALHPTGTSGQVLGGLFTANLSAAGPVGDLAGLAAQVFIPGTGLAAAASAIHIFTGSAAGGTPPTGMYGLNVNAINGGVSNWSIFISNQVQDAAHWAIQTGTGKVEFGDNVLMHGNLTFPGSSSGTASISVPAAAGTPCTLLLPTTSPTANQLLSSAAPSSGACQTSWTSSIVYGTASTTSVTASNPTINTDTNLIQLSPGAGYFNVLANSYTITGGGNYTTTAASSPALTFEIKLCTVSACGSGTVVDLIDITTTALSATALTNATWTLSAVCVTNATGATGNLVCKGTPGLTIDTGASIVTPDSTFADTNIATSANIDLTQALFVQFSVAQSVAGASNSYVQTLASLR